jgi:hypothetical protein
LSSDEQVRFENSSKTAFPFMSFSSRRQTTPFKTLQLRDSRDSSDVSKKCDSTSEIASSYLGPSLSSGVKWAATFGDDIPFCQLRNHFYRFPNCPIVGELKRKSLHRPHSQEADAGGQDQDTL